MRRQNGYSLYIMAEVILKNLKKVYPNAESKKTKKGEPQKKGNLQITDEGVVAVQDFNLHIADKEFIVLVGPSGCGKSTTLRMIAGLEDISGGELTIGGKLGIATGKAAEAIARQPEAESKISKNLILGCALAEATAIYGFIIGILIIILLG